MFRCQMCDRVVPAGVRSQRIVIETRAKEYSPRNQKPERRSWGRRGRPVYRRVYDKGGHGHEIVREVSVCPECAEQYAANQ